MASLGENGVERQPSDPEAIIGSPCPAHDDTKGDVEAANEQSTTTSASVSDAHNNETDSSALSTRPPALQRQPTELEPRHCWICLQDEGEEEDKGKPQEWRAPCPCNLRAHEECLLEWIADLEAEDLRKGKTPKKICCPVCKSEIQIQRPKDLIVSTYNIIRTAGRLLILPAGLSAVAGILYSGSMVYGINACFLIFGKEQAQDILYGYYEQRTLLDFNTVFSSVGRALKSWARPLREPLLEVFNITDPFMPYYFSTESAKLFFGIPLIAPALILSRTNVAEHAFALVPLTYFLTHPLSLRTATWPPSPGLALSILPYFRAAYFEFYRHTFSSLEKQWELAVQRKPREGETADEIAQAHRQRQRDGDLADGGNEDDIEIEIQLNVGLEPDIVIDAPANAPADVPVEVLADAPAAMAQAQALEREVEREIRDLQDIDAQLRDINRRAERVREVLDGQEPVDAEAEAPAGLQQPGMEPAPAPDVPLVRNGGANANGAGAGQAAAGALNLDREFRQVISTAQVASTVMGALFFPAVSSLVGDLLAVTLPRAWVTKPLSSVSGLSSVRGTTATGKATGLLQEKWGRSLVGGCLFVVLKDALGLYVKSRRARDVGRRKIVDYKGGKGKGRRRQMDSGGAH